MKGIKILRMTLEPVPEVPEGSSPAGWLDRNDLKSLGKKLLIATVGAALPVISDWVANTDFGMITPMVTAATVVLIEVISRLLTDYSGKMKGYMKHVE